MTREVLVTWPDESLIAATDRMLSHSVHRLVVVESESERTLPVGILSLTDLTRAGMNDIRAEAK
jgi:CBS domain-containing protein